jgi:hypothetical protein
MKSSSRAPRSLTNGLFGAGFTLGIGLCAAPGIAFADEPSPPPAAMSPPSTAPAPPPSAAPLPPSSGAMSPPPSAEPAPAKQAVSRPLPASVLAMQGHEVVLRLDGASQLQGYLISVNDEGFAVQIPSGNTIRVPRGSVRGVRLAATPAPARPTQAETPPDVDASPPDFLSRRRERSFGFGTAFGGGASGGAGAWGPALLLPTAELQVFMPGEFSIDVSVPVLNMALGSTLIGGTLVGGDLYFSLSAGEGQTRLIAGTGVGFAYVSIGQDAVTSVKIPLQLGFEVLSKRRTFGFKLLARPWLEFANDGATTQTGGGFLAALAFSGYALSDRRQK